MCGMKVVVVASDESGNIDLEDLKAKALKHKDNLVRLTCCETDTSHQRSHAHSSHVETYLAVYLVSIFCRPDLSVSVTSSLTRHVSSLCRPRSW